MQALQKLSRFVRKSPREKLQSIRYHLEDTDWYWKIHSPGKDRTAYIIGLFGTGRWYVNELIRQNIGERARYFREENAAKFPIHPCPTSLIHSCHATLRYVSLGQKPPAMTRRILDLVRSGIADLIFIYRHPLDSLLTNWVWWRIYLLHNMMIPGISTIFKNTDDFCAHLEQDFSDFKAFADGDPGFFADRPGPRFLSFGEFVEETELFIECATLALRLEDFSDDPVREFSKIVKAMSVDVDVSRLHLPPPNSKPYRYLAVKEKVPRFRDFINGLDTETIIRIEKSGYEV
jgi:hypothetical protein